MTVTLKKKPKNIWLAIPSYGGQATIATYKSIIHDMFRLVMDGHSEIWRVLKPGGFFVGTSPAWNSPWAWGDPGHTRIMSRECLIYLDQTEYRQIGHTPMTDYRFCYKADLEVVASEHNNGTYFYGLKAHKPARTI
jgi:SAM-dependent methyltransferase